MKAERETRLNLEQHNVHAKAAGLRAWLREAWVAIKQNWVLFIYMVLLMSFFNACSHGSQDFYPTFLKNRKFAFSYDWKKLMSVQRLGSPSQM